MTGRYPFGGRPSCTAPHGRNILNGGTRMRRIALAILMIIFSTASWADDRDDQRNVYDVFREPPSLPERQLTARIKRHMANLLYPVDMLSFNRPEQDAKFREVVIALQRQMGAPTTGSLTHRQFLRLADAASNIDDHPIGMGPGKIVFRSDDGTLVSAVGTGAMEGIANPINVTRILCMKADSTCEMSSAEFDS